MPRLQNLLVGEDGTTVVGINAPQGKGHLGILLLLRYPEGTHQKGAGKSQYRARLQEITANAFRLGNFKPFSR